MEIKKDLNEFKKFLNSLTEKEFDSILEDAGIEVVKSCEDEDKILLSKVKTKVILS